MSNRLLTKSHLAALSVFPLSKGRAVLLLCCNYSVFHLQNVGFVHAEGAKVGMQRTSQFLNAASH